MSVCLTPCPGDLLGIFGIHIDLLELKNLDKKLGLCQSNAGPGFRYYIKLTNSLRRLSHLIGILLYDLPVPG